MMFFLHSTVSFVGLFVMMASSHKHFTVMEKADIIWRLENSQTNGDVTREFNIGHSTIPSNLEK